MKSFKNFASALSLIMVLCMVLALCSCKKNGSDTDSSSDLSLSSDYVSAGSYSADESDDSSDEATDSSSEAADSSAQQTSGGATSSSGGTASAVQLPTTTNPSGEEILGAGTKDNPYLELPKVSDTHMSVTTVSIPAGKSVYYGIQRVAGTILTIENANAYVIYESDRYNANGGKVSFEVVAPKALASDYISFEIGNKGSAAASFTLIFTNKTGSRENPTTASMGKSFSVSLEAEDSTGHYYKYVAEKAGTIRFTVSGTTDTAISVTNNSNSKNVIGNYAKSSNQLTDPDNGDAVVEYIELEVAKGDEIIINVGTLPNKRGKYSANTISWSGNYA